MPKLQLNGWQRLWILLGVIYLVVVTLITINVIPKRSQVFSSWAYDAVDLIKTHEKTDIYHYTLRKEIFGEASDEELIQRVTNGVAKENDKEWGRKVQGLEERYKKRIDSLLKEQLETIGFALLAWLIPMVLLYAFGYGVGWVYRGFKQ